VKLVAQVKLTPTAEQAMALEATLRACNHEANRARFSPISPGTRTRAALQPVASAGLSAAAGGADLL